VNGNLNWWGKLKFVWHRKVHPATTMFGVIFGVVKDYQGKGVEGAMIKYAETDIAHKTPYLDTILGWIGDFNPKMLKVCENLGATNYRTYATYRYLFDRSLPFERAPIIGSDKKEEKAE
jgi:GNAT superfamily N-acetyltransferase